MERYHKIQTAYLRDPETNHKTLLEGEWAKVEFGVLKDIGWYCTEKIDGTNIRVIWDGAEVAFKGKSDKASIPPHLLEQLTETFPAPKMYKVFGVPESPMCLYGEGYGVKIQKGGNYMSDRVGFILFDVKIGVWWLKRWDIEGIADNLNVPIVPLIGVMRLEEAVRMVKEGFKSTIAENKNYMAEGLVMKPIVELFNRRGERVITKIKHKDFDSKQ